MDIKFGDYNFRISTKGNSKYVFDIIRKKYVALTPEEKVRQYWIQYLIHDLKFPRALIAVETPLTLNGLNKRCDIVVFDRNGQPFLIIECKAAGVKLTQKVFDQISRYNLILKVPNLIVTNGVIHFCCEIDFVNSTFKFLNNIPHPG